MWPAYVILQNIIKISKTMAWKLVPGPSGKWNFTFFSCNIK